jgi:hypothetical protein
MLLVIRFLLYHVCAANIHDKRVCLAPSCNVLVVIGAKWPFGVAMLRSRTTQKRHHLRVASSAV